MSAASIVTSKERFRGYHLISCDSESAVRILRDFVGSMNPPKKEAKLKVMFIKKLPVLSEAYDCIYIPAEVKHVGRDFRDKN